MPARLIESLATTELLADVFSDSSVLQAMLDFESALARAGAREGIVPKNAAKSIAQAAKAEDFDVAELCRGTLRAGTPGIPLVKMLTQRVKSKDAAAAGFVHWGATSQDVADTALVILLRKSQPLIESDVRRLEQALRRAAAKHENTVMLGRTLLQPSPPVTFGLKAAGWLAAIARSRASLNAAFEEALLLQFGGASGTLASLGDKGIAVARALAQELDLKLPEAPWHTQRDRLANLVCACGVLTGSLGKIARDIALLMQGEVREASEPGGDGRGGSSTMPHKRNPIGCAVTLAAAQRVPGLVAGFLSCMVQEHERGVGGWQSEWPTMAGVIQSTGLAAASMAEVAEGLSVDTARMRENIEATRGAIFAEKAAMLLAAKLGRSAAHKILEDAGREGLSQNRNLADVLAERREAAAQLDRAALKRLEVPEEYLGSAEKFRAALLSSRKGNHSARKKD